MWMVCIVKVLGDIDTHKVLEMEIDIEWRGYNYHKRFNYSNIPFQCLLYRQTWHLRKECFGKKPKEKFLKKGDYLDMQS